jgi:hypothetical protein
MSLAMQIYVLSFLVLDLLGVSLVYFICTWMAPLALLMNFFYSIKKIIIIKKVVYMCIISPNIKTHNQHCYMLGSRAKHVNSSKASYHN